MDKSPSKRSPNSFQKKQQDYLEQEQDEIFSRYPFFHQGVPDLPDELYPMPKKRTNYKIDEFQNYNQDNALSGNVRFRKRSSNIITEESPFYMDQYMRNNESEEKFSYPQLTKQQLKQQERHLNILNEQKKQMSYKMKEERENKRKAYEQYLEQLNDQTFEKVVQMTKEPEKKIQITIDENNVSIDCVPQSVIRKMEEGTQEFYEKERNLHQKKKSIKQKLVDKFNVRLNFETEAFQDKSVYDFYNSQQIKDIRSQRKQSLQLNPIAKQDGQQYGMNNNSINNLNENKPQLLYMKQNDELPSSLQQKITNRATRKFNSLQSSPRTTNENTFYNQYSNQNNNQNQTNNQISLQTIINQNSEYNVFNNGQSSQLSQNKQPLQPINNKQSDRSLTNNNNHSNNYSSKNNIQKSEKKKTEMSNQYLPQNNQNSTIELIDMTNTKSRNMSLGNREAEQLDIQTTTQQSRQKGGDSSIQFTETSPKSLQLRTSPGKRHRDESPFLTSAPQYPHQKFLTMIQTKQNNHSNGSSNNNLSAAKNQLDLSLQQYQIPTEASQQYSPNSQDRSDNISPFLFQSSSRNSTQFPSIASKPHNNRIGSSFSRYKVTSPHSTRNNVYSFSKEVENSSILKQGGEALEALKKENQQLLNSKYTRQHAKIINNIRKRSTQIEQAMKETDDSFSHIVGKIKNEQVKILTNLCTAKAPQSVQIRLINDFQNILGVYGAQLN